MPRITETTDAPDIGTAAAANTPYVIASGDIFQGDLNTGDRDSDFIAFNVQAGYDYLARFVPGAGAGLGGTFFSAFAPGSLRPSGSFASVSDYTGDDTPTQLVVATSTTGRWYLEPRWNGTITGTGQYSVTLLREEGSTHATTSQVEVGDTFLGRIDYAANDEGFGDGNPGDTDTIAIQLQAGVTYTFTLTAPTGANFNMSLEDAQFDFVGGVQVSANGGSATFQATPDASGRYFLDVSDGGENQVGDYSLRVSVPGVTRSGGAGPDTLIGTAGDDALSGGGGTDSLYGGGGADRLDGGDGADRILAGNGADTVNGGAGNDVISGGATVADLRDVIYGGDGNDRIDGGAGNDLLNGGNGNDVIEGGAGADTVIGNAGNDVLTGSAFSDLIFGNDGFDFINGGFGSDRVNGGDDADRFFHVGVAGHGSDFVQDYSGRGGDGDVLVWGGGAANVGQFQVNLATTAGAGDATQEAFVIYRPTGQILWALIDGADDTILLQIGADVFEIG